MFYFQELGTQYIPRFCYNNYSRIYCRRSGTAAASSSGAVCPSRGRSDRSETWLSDRGPPCCAACAAFYPASRISPPSSPAGTPCCSFGCPRAFPAPSRTASGPLVAADDRRADSGRRRSSPLAPWRRDAPARWRCCRCARNRYRAEFVKNIYACIKRNRVVHKRVRRDLEHGVAQRDGKLPRWAVVAGQIFGMPLDTAQILGILPWSAIILA